MKYRRIFTYIWRVNGVIILMTGLLGAGLLTIAAGLMFVDLIRPRRIQNVVNIGREEVKKVETSLGSFDPISGVQVLRSPLYLEQDYSHGSASRSKQAGSIQNYLFYDLLTRTSYWLRPEGPGLILRTQPIEIPEDSNTNQRKVIGFLYLVVDEDTNQDGFLSANDTTYLAISDPKGTRFVTLIETVDEFKGYGLTDNQNLTVLYTVESKLKAAELNLEAQTVISEVELQDLQVEADPLQPEVLP